MAEPSSSLDDLVAAAVAIARGPSGPADDERVWPVLQEAAVFGRAALDAAVVLTASREPCERAIACYLLAALCNPDEQGFSSDAASALVALATDEEDTDVWSSIACALGFTRDPRGVPVLARLATQFDSAIRFQVAQALPACEDGADPAILTDALVVLMKDGDEDVRD